MPGLNRIRIINFSYNNDAREIVDETFDFYDGENALLNLANGGGKSVLVQLMLQPILPDLKLQRRKMADYIRSGASPVFVILEWVLDNPAMKDYLMTGIAIAPRSAMQNEDSNKINYFTFASHYDQACEFDLASVPFARKEEGRMILMPFERSREAVKKLVSSYREMFYYSREDGAEYRKLLSSFGISQEEWRGIIARMNNDEGGIDELFERCSTSDGVFNEWIIKNIEKAQMAGAAGGTEIEELLAGLVTDTMNNEEYLKAQKIIGSYLTRHQQIEEGLEGVCHSLEMLEQARRALGGMYQALKKKVREAEAELTELEGKQKELEAKQRHIRMEEASEQYYETKASYEEAVVLTEEIQKKQEDISRLLKESRYLLECWQAAKILEECRRIKGKMEGIRGNIDAQKGDSHVKERMDDLAYSLSVRCEERCGELESSIVSLDADIRELTKAQEVWDRQRAELEGRLNQLNNQTGKLEAETGQFEQYESRVFRELGTTFLRNILKELETEGTDKYARALTVQETREAGRLLQFKEREEEIGDRQTELSGLLLENGRRAYETEHDLKQKEAEQEELETWKSRAGELLIKYEIPVEFLYEQKQIGGMLEQKIRRQEGQRYQLLLDEKQIADMLHGMENHCVYMPEALLKSLEQQDIACQTGESYLGNLGEDKRRLQLRKNPLLPFGLIARGTDRKRLEEVSFGDCFLRQVVPVFTYEQLDHAYPSNHQIVDVGEQIGMISSYEERIFGDDPRMEYVSQLKTRQTELRELVRHREEELNQLRESDAFFRESPYSGESEAKLERMLEKLLGVLESLEKQKKDWEWEQESLRQERLQIEAMRENAEESLGKIRKKQETLAEYLTRNGAYEEHCRQLCCMREEIQKAVEEAEELSRKLDESRREVGEKQKSLIHARHRLEEAQKTAALYRDASPGRLLTEPFSEMEQEYKQLTKRLNASLSVLMKELEEQNREYERQKTELSELTVREADYADLVFNREEAAAKRAEAGRLAEEEKGCYQELSRAQNRLGEAKGQWGSAERHLRELGLSNPLSREEIRQDYERRRAEAEAQLARMASRRKDVENTRASCQGIAGRIEDMGVSLVSGQGFVLAEDRTEQFEALREALKEAKVLASRERKGCARLYRTVAQEFQDKNQCVTDILESLASLRLEDGDITYEGVYYSMEEFVKKKESLIKLLDFYDGQLASIVHTKNQIVDQCISYARMIYEDVKLIARKSKVQLSGKNRPVQMLKVGVPDALDTEVRQRMARHIDESLRILTEMGKAEDIPEKKWKEKLSLFMSSRELFNQLIGTNKVPVYVYKIDLSEKGSGLKRWEDAMIQNSGGEKVVAFFTMISTLISYIRDVTRQNAGGEAGQESKVIIMDNPFGRTSSEHLLKAIMDIARTFKIQLICLSDLSQSSITNRFSLIYQLSIRKRMYSDKEVLKSEPVRLNQAGLERNERLEHVGVYEAGGQTMLWEFMKDV